MKFPIAASGLRSYLVRRSVVKSRLADACLVPIPHRRDNRCGDGSLIPRGRHILAACAQLKSETERMRKTERRAFETTMIPAIAPTGGQQ